MTEISYLNKQNIPFHSLRKYPNSVDGHSSHLGQNNDEEFDRRMTSDPHINTNSKQIASQLYSLLGSVSKFKVDKLNAIFAYAHPSLFSIDIHDCKNLYKQSPIR